MLPRVVWVLLCAALLSACGAEQSTGVDEFSGEQRRVAEAVAELSAAGADGDAAQICSDLLTPQLADRLKAGTRTCTDELEDSLGDADEFGLTTREVAVNGTSATVRVEVGEGGLRTLDLVRQGRSWRVASIRPA